MTSIHLKNFKCIGNVQNLFMCKDLHLDFYEVYLERVCTEKMWD